MLLALWFSIVLHQHVILATCKVMVAMSSELVAVKYMRDFEHQLMRLAVSKSATSTFHPGVSGQLTNAKLEIMRNNWIIYVEKDCGAFTGLGAKIGIPTCDDTEVVDEVGCSPRWNTMWGSATPTELQWGPTTRRPALGTVPADLVGNSMFLFEMNVLIWK